MISEQRSDRVHDDKSEWEAGLHRTVLVHRCNEQAGVLRVVHNELHLVRTLAAVEVVEDNVEAAVGIPANCRSIHRNRPEWAGRREVDSC